MATASGPGRGTRRLFGSALASEVVRAQVAFVHVLRTALRGQGGPPEAAKYLTPEVLASVESSHNRQSAVLVAIDRRCSTACCPGSSRGHSASSCRSPWCRTSGGSRRSVRGSSVEIDLTELIGVQAPAQVIPVDRVLR